MKAYDHEIADWRAAVNDMSEMDWAAHDDPQTYADVHR